jgi:hypothetical protein
MATTKQDDVKWSRHCCEVTGSKAIDRHALTAGALQDRYIMASPKNRVRGRAIDCPDPVREEAHRGPVKGLDCRADDFIVDAPNNPQLTSGVDIDEPTVLQMVKSTGSMRHQMAWEAWRLTVDVEHPNRVNGGDQPIFVRRDFRADVQPAGLVGVSRHVSVTSSEVTDECGGCVAGAAVSARRQRRHLRADVSGSEQGCEAQDVLGARRTLDGAQ